MAAATTRQVCKAILFAAKGHVGPFSSQGSAACQPGTSKQLFVPANNSNIITVEPVGAALAVLGLLKPAFEACRDIYKGYKLTQSFGEDYDIAKRNYDFQVARLEAISRKKLTFLKEDFNPWNENDPITRETISKLIVINAHLATCSRLFKKYHDQETLVEVEDSNMPDSDNTVQENVVPIVATPTPNPESQDGLLFSPRSKVPAGEKAKRGFTKLIWRGLKKKKKKGKGPREEAQSHSSLQVSKEASLATSSRSRSASIDISRTSIDSEGPESPDQGRDSQAGTTEPTSVSVILSSPAVVAANRERENHSRRLQDSNNFFKLVLWSADDRSLLFSEIKEIRDCNTDLESLLRYREPRNPGQILDLDQPFSPAIKNVRQIQNALKRLHEALISSNRNIKAENLRISIKLVADCGEIAQDLSQEDNLTFRENSYIFVLQVHKTTAEGTAAVEVLAETLSLESSPNRALASQQIEEDENQKVTSLLEALSHIQIGTNDNAFDFLGSVSRPGSLWDRHRLFYDTENQWYSTQTLYNVIETDDFREKLNPIQRAQLATLLSITHLYFANVRTTTSQPQLSQFVFYTTCNQPPDWNEFERFVLNPYLSFGFGNRKQNVNPGSRSGIAKWKKSNSIVELGLLLHQIGSYVKLDFGEGDEGRRHAKEEALRTLHAVDRGSGGKFTEVVEMCLNWGGSMSAEMGDEECEVVQRVVQWLMRFEQNL